MSYFVVCTFDLQNASHQDYQDAYADLARIGLRKTLSSDDHKSITLPTTTTAGQFNGASAGSVRDSVTEQVRSAFSARRFKSEIFVSVGGNWAWAHRTT